MPSRRNADEFRTVAALMAGAMGVFICLIQKHVTTLSTLPNHRCGQCLLFAMVWIAVECTNLVIPQRELAR